MATIDFEAEGLLAGLEGQAREDRLALLRTLCEQGFGLDELKRATAEGRLVLLPMERVLEPEGPRYTQREVCAETGLEFEFLAEARRAIGAPAVEPDQRVLTEADFNLARNAAALIAGGLSQEAFLELTRVMSKSMATVATALTAAFGEDLLHPGDSEHELGLRYAEALRHLGPLAAPALGELLNRHLLEVLRNAVVGETELRTGHLPGAQPVTVGFVDIVGFTRLGEEIPPEELGALVHQFERAVERAVDPPVRLVKTIGDAAMLVSAEPRPAIDTVLGLVEQSGEGNGVPLLRGGVASGEALQRAGDWYGRPVNLASRLTSFARRGSVVVSNELHEVLGENAYAWSFAGYRRFKGVGSVVPVWRVRR